jgi:hypothetical protein
MSNENPIHEGNEKSDRQTPPTLIQVPFPEQPTVVFFTAIIIGLLLISMTTIFRSYFAVNGMQSNLVQCLGVALLAVAFGSQATVRTGRIIMAGVAAIAFCFFIYLQYSSRELFLRGWIKGFDFATYKSLGIQKNSVLGRIEQNDKNLERSEYDFIIFKKAVDTNFIEVVLETREKKERVIYVDAGEFEWAYGRPQRLVWELREESVGSERIIKLYDISNDIKGHPIGSEVTRGTLPITRAPIDAVFINAAFAQEGAPIDVPLMLERLKAEDAPTRRSARTALSKAPIESIPVIMAKLHQEGSNYQVKLGICVALTEMLRADKNRRTKISSMLKEDDLNKLLDAAGDSDRTVRIYATEFLFDLGDKRATKLAILRAAKTNDDNARYNWLLLSQDGWRMLTQDEKAELTVSYKEAYERSGEKTRQLFDKLPL